MVMLPRLVIAAPSTGQGRTTIATGLMAALRLAGHEVSGYKVGPDYIDPGYHALATGRPGRNLDPHLVGEARIVPLLLHGAKGAEIAIVEGVMGLYDGRLGTDGYASTAYVAKLTRSPVVMVIDVAMMSRSAAAIAAGMVAYDRRRGHRRGDPQPHRLTAQRGRDRRGRRAPALDTALPNGAQGIYLGGGFPEAYAADQAARAAKPHRTYANALPTSNTAKPPPASAGREGNPLKHHGDAEIGTGLLDFAVNVFAGPRPHWLERALHDSLAEAASYPDVTTATSAIAQQHSRTIKEVLPTAGAAEAFSLIARLRPWRRPVVVHPQFTEPHTALEQAGHEVTTVLCTPERGFALNPDDVPEDADLVIVGNPTNPTGVVHSADLLKRLRRSGRIVVVDEAFMDAVPGEGESLVRERLRDLVVIRSLTKHWSIPGIRAGYVVGHRCVIQHLAAQQMPWSVSTPAIAAMIACSQRQATLESRDRALTLTRWRQLLEGGLASRGIEYVPSSASFVLARLGEGAHAALREDGVAVRRADTFPGLDATWVRIAVRPPATTARFFAAFDGLEASA